MRIRNNFYFPFIFNHNCKNIIQSHPNGDYQALRNMTVGDENRRQKWIKSSVAHKVNTYKAMSCVSSFYDINPTLLPFGNNKTLMNKYIQTIDINNSGFRSLMINWPGTENEFKNETIILAIHGGSNVGGAPEHYRSFLVLLSKLANATCYSIGHGLAPDYIAPKQVDHLIDAYKYVLEKHQDIDKIFISGHSGGGNIALLTLQKLLTMKDNIRYPDGGIIIAPNVDRQFDDMYNKDRDCLPDWEMMHEMEHLAVGNIDMNGEWKSEEEKVDLRDPLLSPLYGEMKGLCDLYWSRLLKRFTNWAIFINPIRGQVPICAYPNLCKNFFRATGEI